MKDYLKAVAITLTLLVALSASTFATSRPGETLHIARDAARSLCAMPGGVSAACRQLARLRAVRPGQPQTLRS